MAEGKRTYYQVSFTGGQALSAVAVVILALGLSFFLGAKAGFERAPEPGAPAGPKPSPPVNAAAPAPAEASATGTPAAGTATTSASAAPEEAPVFEDREAGVAEKAPSAAPSRTEIAGAPGPPSSKPAPAKPPSAAAPRSAGEKSKSAGEAPKSAAGEAAKSAAGEAVRSAAGEPATGEREAGAKSSAARPGGYFVQILSTSSRAEANRWKEKLAARSYRTAAVSTVQSKKGTLWRVRVGPYADRALAKKAAAKISTEFKQKAWVAAE